MKRKGDRNVRLVFTSDGGAVDQPAAKKQAPEGDGIVRVRRETKGRGGKTVSVIMGLPLVGAELKALAKALKKRCGTGGSVVEDRIEIQGDHVDTLIAELGKRGHEVKRSGG